MSKDKHTFSCPNCGNEDTAHMTVLLTEVRKYKMTADGCAGEFIDVENVEGSQSFCELCDHQLEET
jgi:hypothetical protein